jgi:hypothetical protein
MGEKIPQRRSLAGEENLAVSSTSLAVRVPLILKESVHQRRTTGCSRVSARGNQADRAISIDLMMNSANPSRYDLGKAAQRPPACSSATRS